MTVDHLFPDGMVTQYVVIAEVLSEDGERSFQMRNADASGQGLPWWTVEGLLAAAVQTYAAVPPIPSPPDDDE